MGDKMSDKLDKLSKAYEAFLDSDDPDIANAYAEVIANLIKRVSKEVGDTPLRDMATSQLESVYELYGYKSGSYIGTTYSFVGDGYYSGSYGTPSKTSATFSISNGTLSGIPSGLTSLDVLVTIGV